MTLSRRALACALPFLAACSNGAQWRMEDAAAADSLELQLDASGVTREIEYHVAPGTVPDAVHEAMNALHPGGEAVGAEREYVGELLCWELTKVVDGREVEAMFLEDGTLYAEEVQLDAEAVPEAVRAALEDSEWGAVTSWEEIRDAERAVVRYHAKTERNGRRYKLLLETDGALTAVFREVAAEVEVPVR